MSDFTLDLERWDEIKYKQIASVIFDFMKYHYSDNRLPKGIVIAVLENLLNKRMGQLIMGATTTIDIVDVLCDFDLILSNKQTIAELVKLMHNIRIAYREALPNVFCEKLFSPWEMPLENHQELHNRLVQANNRIIAEWLLYGVKSINIAGLIDELFLLLDENKLLIHKAIGEHPHWMFDYQNVKVELQRLGSFVRLHVGISADIDNGISAFIKGDLK